WNDVLIGYSRFSASQYPSANYAFRSEQDPLESQRDDAVLKAGEAPYVAIDSRKINNWGNWSAATVDPLNDADLWTLQEYASTPAGGVSRWGTWWGRISPPVNLTLTTVDSPAMVNQGTPLTYTLAVTNSYFGHNCSGVKIIETLPAGVTFVSATASQ